MTSKHYVWIAMLMLAGSTGCAMCDNSHDASYTALGGKWQRDTPHSGRVGSAFDPAGMQVVDSSAFVETEMPVEIWEEEGEIEPLLEDAENEMAEGETTNEATNEAADETADETADEPQTPESTLPQAEMPGTETPGTKTPDTEIHERELPEMAADEEAERGVPNADAEDPRKPATGEPGWRRLLNDSSKAAPQADETDLLPPLEFAP